MSILYIPIYPGYCVMHWGLVDDPYKVTRQMINYVDPEGDVHTAEGVRPSEATQTIESLPQTPGKIIITFDNK